MNPQSDGIAQPMGHRLAPNGEGEGSLVDYVNDSIRK